MTKIKTVLTSVVTYATLASAAITMVMAELQSQDVLPEDWTGTAIRWGTTAVAVLGLIVSVIKRVMPVSNDGAEVLTPAGQEFMQHTHNMGGDPLTRPVERGWGESA